VSWLGAMSDMSQILDRAQPARLLRGLSAGHGDGAVHFVERGTGAPVVLLHGIAASLHDWDELIPALAANGHKAYALDLLGHGRSAKPAARDYQMDWLFDHFSAWLDSLRLSDPPVLVGHSMGAYLALQYAVRFPDRVRALVLSNPYYRPHQLSLFLRRAHRRSALNYLVLKHTPRWLYRLFVDLASLMQGNTGLGVHSLPLKVRIQSAVDYRRTAPGAYNAIHTVEELLPGLSVIYQPVLVVWGDRDLTLSPMSFQSLIDALPHAQGRRIPGAGHVLHQANSQEFNQLVLDFLKTLG